MTDNGWEEYKIYVLKELDNIKEEMRNNQADMLREVESLIREYINDLKISLVPLKMKVSLYGVIAGAIPSLITALILLLRFWDKI